MRTKIFSSVALSTDAHNNHTHLVASSQQGNIYYKYIKKKEIGVTLITSNVNYRECSLNKICR